MCNVLILKFIFDALYEETFQDSFVLMLTNFSTIFFSFSTSKAEQVCFFVFML